jgi:hypothetical protein
LISANVIEILINVVSTDPGSVAAAAREWRAIPALSKLSMR